MNKFVKVNPNLCIACKTCMIACVVAHEGKQIFEIDADSYDFHPRLWVKQTDKQTTIVQCKNCANPRCLSACPIGAISMGEDRIYLDEAKCVGCGRCEKACPFGAVRVAALRPATEGGRIRRIAFKCDLCEAKNSGPSCVAACPTDALELVGGSTLQVARDA